MGKVKKNIYISVVILCVFFLLYPFYTVKADVASNVQVEQIVSEMPELKAYLLGKDVATLDLQQINAWLGNEKLEIDNLQRYYDSGEGIRYFWLLDISSSISGEDFQALKNAILDLAQRLEQKDKATLLTFGDEVNLFWDSDEGIDNLKSRLDTLVNDNMNTQLYEALIQAADLCAQSNDTMRKSAIVLTDGVDDIRGKSTKTEAMSKILQNGMPVYGIAVGDAESENVDRFGELVRSSHGRLLLAQKENAEKTLRQLNKNIKSAWILTMKADSNLVSKSVQEVKLQFNQYNLIRNIKTGFYHWQPDNENPWVVNAEQIERNQLQVVFSEPVQGLEAAANFELKNSNGRLLVPKSVASVDKRTVKLTFDDDFYEGDYTLSCNNIKDISMEENEVIDEFSLSLEGERESRIKDFLMTWGWLGAIIVVLLAVIVLFIIYRKIRRHKGMVVIEDKLAFVSDMEDNVRQVVKVNPKEGLHLLLYTSTGMSKPIKLERNLYNSIIIGRSDICDVCIQDHKMSKQHFVLEYDSGYVFVSDLESTNGTMLNGILLTSRRKLEKGDKISAGNTLICVKW